MFFRKITIFNPLAEPEGVGIFKMVLGAFSPCGVEQFPRPGASVY